MLRNTSGSRSAAMPPAFPNASPAVVGMHNSLADHFDCRTQAAPCSSSRGARQVACQAPLGVARAPAGLGSSRHQVTPSSLITLAGHHQVCSLVIDILKHLCVADVQPLESVCMRHSQAVAWVCFPRAAVLRQHTHTL